MDCKQTKSLIKDNISSSSNQVSVAFWTHKTTITFLHAYKECLEKLGTMEIKNKKQCWEAIADKVNRAHNTNFLPAHCENRWRVIQRGYKKYMDVSKSNKRKRPSFFEYAKEMNEIMGEQINVDVVPEHCIKTIRTIEVSDDEQQSIEDYEVIYEKGEPEVVVPSSQKQVFVKRSVPIKRKKPSILPIQKSTLELMRRDKKEYYTQLIKAQNDKLSFERDKFKQKMELEKMKIEVRREENKVNQERNEILREYLKNSVTVPNNTFY